MSTRRTRKPTGKASWPLVLLAGREKCGKSYTASAFSASDLIDRTFFIEIGEGSADQYGAIPGARYEIVEHDGSWADILAAVEWAVDQPRPNGKPHALVLDSMTELWGLLADEQESISRKRGKDTITIDQWNSAKKRWRKVIDAARRNAGPSIFTARYNEVTVMRNGKPTAEKEWKVDAEKNLAYEVDAIITWKQPREPFINGVRTVAFDVPAHGFAPKDPANFDLDKFFRSLNIDGAERVYIPRKEDPDAHQPAPDAVRPDELPPEPTLNDAAYEWAGTEEPTNA
ncbi:AAA family ATPase [Pseudactinotalea sp. Z1732]|uniref:AAA family ATPase n=1 Tax=Micrococcales TaxID=85006 RepID=UPI003C7B60EB